MQIGIKYMMSVKMRQKFLLLIETIYRAWCKDESEIVLLGL